MFLFVSGGVVVVVLGYTAVLVLHADFVCTSDTPELRRNCIPEAIYFLRTIFSVT